MEFLHDIAVLFASLPDFVTLLPACAVFLGGCVCAVWKKKGAFCVVLFLGASLSLLLACGKGASACAFCLAVTGISGSLSGLFFLGKGKAKGDEKMYETFRAALDERPVPPKVDCFSLPMASPSLSHCSVLLDKLKKEKLTPADRLEVEVISRRIEGSAGRTLASDEADILNDCLASVLRLTAKYKL